MKNWILAQAYQYTGVHSGIRPDPNRLDLAVVVSERPACAAGAFTRNQIQAAPVRVCKERLPSSHARGIVLCSGNANACTGAKGLDDARRMTAVAAQQLGCAAEDFLVCSTGVIGRHLPMDKIEPGIVQACKQLGNDDASLERAARAILTTDTRIKVASRSVTLEGQEIRLTGFAKGAAMIGPNMATLLAVVLTDAAVSEHDLAAIVPRAAARSFNCISVEGHTSTNDTLLLLANGTGPRLQGKALKRYEEEVAAICIDLARDMASDAEGASHFVTIEVEGLRNDAEAYKIAKAVADSPLNKTALFGADPNWGRIVSAAGYAGVDFDESQLSLWLGDYLLYREGTPMPFDAAATSAYLKNNRNLLIRLVFTLGQGRCTFYSCDLTYEYIRLNADYTT